MIAVVAGALLIGAGVCWSGEGCGCSNCSNSGKAVSFAADGAPAGARELTAAALQDLPNDCVIMIFKPGCGPCTATKPVFAQAAQMSRGGVPMFIGNISDPQVHALAQKIGVSGVPHIGRFKNGQQVAVYQGPRIAESFVEFARV